VILKDGMFVLCLNDMRGPKVEVLSPVCCAESAEELVRLMEREKSEPYDDGRWRKAFRKGGPLEWYNRPYVNSFEWIEREMHIMQYFAKTLPHVSELT